MQRGTASDQITQQMLNNAASTNTGPVIGLTAKPKISVKPGPQKSPITIKLSDFTRGAAALEGEIKRPNAAVLIPVVGPFTLFRHSKDADIKTGTPFAAYLDTTTLTAAK
jgi:hypothetical protein